jgi:TPR repeat protein
MMALGYAYQTGQGVEADLTEAARWYEQAAVAGREDAQAALDALNP